MAQKFRVLLVDDLDGGRAEQTVSFSLDGCGYEIDLSNANAARLREALAPFVSAARLAPARPSEAQAAAPAQCRQRTAEIRAWARARGERVNGRGRIPRAVVDAYHAARQHR